MRINGTKTPEVAQRAEDAAKPAATPAGAAAATAAAVPGAAPVVVSARAQEIVAGGQRDAVAHNARLGALKEALDRGTYKVDHEKLAESIIADEIDRTKA